MRLVSAYLIRQSGKVGSGLEPVSKSKLKDWLKNDRENYGNHLYFFPGSSNGTMPNPGGGRFWLETRWKDMEKSDLWAHMLAKANNQNANADGFITCVSASAYLWALDYTPIYYFSYDEFDADGVRLMDGNNACPVSLKVDRCDSSYSTIVSDNISASDFLEQYKANTNPSGVVKVTEGYAVYMNLGVPRFSTAEEGAAYVSALRTYLTTPTDANYNAVCDALDNASNPD